jgi:DNA topoisomerase-1
MRELGPHPDDQAPINLYDGRYGPYVKHGTVSASIPRGQDPASVTLAQAVELIAIRAAMGGGKKSRRVSTGVEAGRSVSKKATKPKKAKKVEA